MFARQNLQLFYMFGPAGLHMQDPEEPQTWYLQRSGYFLNFRLERFRDCEVVSGLQDYIEPGGQASNVVLKMYIGCFLNF